MAQPQIKISYFNFTGRAEISRLVLVAAGRDFEDHRYKEGEWAESARDKTPFGQCPVLTVNGKQYGQSLAIATYLARECGLYGSSNLDGLQIDQYMQLLGDLINCCVKAMREKDEAEKAKLWEAVKAEDSPKFFAFFEKALADNKTGFMVGNKLSLADLGVYDFVSGMMKDRICPLDKFPLIAKLCAKVAEVPGIKAWKAKQQ